MEKELGKKYKIEYANVAGYFDTKEYVVPQKILELEDDWEIENYLQEKLIHNTGDEEIKLISHEALTE